MQGHAMQGHAKGAMQVAAARRRAPRRMRQRMRARRAPTAAPSLPPRSFEWANCDVSDKGQVQEVYELLSLNYVEDDDAMFRWGGCNKAWWHGVAAACALWRRPRALGPGAGSPPY
jgi:hypothetical protein